MTSRNRAETRHPVTEVFIKLVGCRRHLRQRWQSLPWKQYVTPTEPKVSVQTSWRRPGEHVENFSIVCGTSPPCHWTGVGKPWWFCAWYQAGSRWPTTSRVNWVPLSLVIIAGTPKREIHPWNIVEAHSAGEIPTRGITSGHPVDLSMHVKRYVNPWDEDRGPKSFTWTCANLLKGTGIFYGWSLTLRRTCHINKGDRNSTNHTTPDESGRYKTSRSMSPSVW